MYVVDICLRSVARRLSVRRVFVLAQYEAKRRGVCRVRRALHSNPRESLSVKNVLMATDLKHLLEIAVLI